MSADILYLGDPALHFWLTRSVARVMGVNLSDAMREGQLAASGYAEMVNRCRHCAHVSACQQWLGDPQARASDTPPGCAIAPVLARLAARELA